MGCCTIRDKDKKKKDDEEEHLNPIPSTDYDVSSTLSVE